MTSPAAPIDPATRGPGQGQGQAQAPPPPSYDGLPRVLTYPSYPSSSASASASASAPPPAPELITQGAEGRLYKTTFLTPDLPCALKYRPPKPYRHPALDARLTRQRILAEARILQRCRREAAPLPASAGGGCGAIVPALYAVDEAAGWMMMEWVEGAPVRARLNEWLARRQEKQRRNTDKTGTESGGNKEEEGADEKDLQQNPNLLSLMRRIGAVVGSIHRLGVVHGDLTTSNLMLRPLAPAEGDGDKEGSKEKEDDDRLLDGEIVVIDFGLASQSTSEEDRAVDLYVLERAFGSTHPRAEGLFPEVLRAYGEAFKQAGPVLRKLEDVRMRGRKRSMLG